MSDKITNVRLLLFGALGLIGGCSLFTDLGGLQGGASDGAGAAGSGGGVSSGGAGGGGAGGGSGATGNAGVGAGMVVGLPDGDLDGDDIDDLGVFAAIDGGTLLVFSGGPDFAPSGVDSATSRVLSSPTCTLRAPWRLMDFQSDGATDVVAGLDCGASLELVVLEGPLPLGDSTVDDFNLRVTLPFPELPAIVGLAEVTGDGRADLIATYPDATNGSGVATGLVMVFSDAEATIASGMAVPHAVIEGDAADDRFGNAIDPVSGDVTGDGQGDLLVGAHRADLTGPNSGGAYLFAGPIPRGNHRASELSFARFLGNTAGSLAGVGIAMGDVDLDGAIDVLIGADEDSGGGPYAGRVFIFPGPIEDGAVLLNTAPKFISGLAYDEVGTAIETHGDINGDGARDVLAWGCCAHSGGFTSVGVLVGVFAEDGFGAVTTANADFSVFGDGQSDRYGHAKVPGDLNDDGFEDYVVGLGAWTMDQGKIFVTFGGSALVSGTASQASDLVMTGTPGSTDQLGLVVLGR